MSTFYRISGRVALLGLTMLAVTFVADSAEALHWISKFDAGWWVGWISAMAFLGLFPSARPFR